MYVEVWLSQQAALLVPDIVLRVLNMCKYMQYTGSNFHFLRGEKLQREGGWLG